MGTVLQVQGIYTQAEQIYQESLRAFEETGDRWEQTAPLRNLGHLSWMQGEYEQTAHFYLRSIALCQGMRGTWLLTRGLEGLGLRTGQLRARGHAPGCGLETAHRLGGSHPAHHARQLRPHDQFAAHFPQFAGF